MTVLQTTEFKQWYLKCNLKDRAQIDSRIARIEDFDHFGDCKLIDNNLAELRWKIGRRIYFTRVGEHTILLLLGGLKNAQKKDIKKAKLLLKRYAES